MKKIFKLKKRRVKMELKINPYSMVNSIGNSFSPSQNYYKATKRFENILETKLNVNKNELYLNKKTKATNIDSELFKNEDFKLNEVENNLNKETEKINPQREIENIFKNAKDFDFEDIRKKSNISAKEIDELLENTRLKGMGSAFKSAEEKYNVNALFLVSLAKLESNFGESKIAKAKNNLFGMGAYDRNPFKFAKTYSNFESSINDVAKHLSNNYLRKGAPYFNGYSIDDVNKYYSTDKMWSSKIKKIGNRIINK